MEKCEQTNIFFSKNFVFWVREGFEESFLLKRETFNFYKV